MKQQKAPAWEEFDFRSVSEEHLHLAIFYEYWRERSWAASEFERWHSQKLHLSDNWSEKAEWEETTVRDVLEIIETKEVPFEIQGAALDCMPEALQSPPLDDLYIISPLFPLPFLKLKRIDELALDHFGPIKRRCAAFTILKKPPAYSKPQRRRMAESGDFICTARISVRAGKADRQRRITALA
jgi:hypothetical protein